MKASTGLPNDEKKYLDGASTYESDSGLDNEASTSGSTHTKRSDPEADTVAPKKPRESVEVAKWSVTFMLLVTAALVTTSTFLFLQREERNSFENAVRRDMEQPCCLCR